MIPKQEVRKQEVRMFGNTMEMLGNETSNIAAIAHGNENPGGFVRNMFCNGFTNSVEEASDEFSMVAVCYLLKISKIACTVE